MQFLCRALSVVVSLLCMIQGDMVWYEMFIMRLQMYFDDTDDST